mmetsp:Transcript_47703/g.102177  ORF Transcript_47703/g.102177 Transcript_47703/m.102177 type:complete len:319 (-) Transcript_47703:882-1838(-)
MLLLLGSSRFLHEAVVLLRTLHLLRLCLCLQAREVALDDLQHPDHATSVSLHALVGSHLGDLLLLLDQRRGRCLGVVELLQNDQSLLHSLSALGGVLDGLEVLALLLRSQGGGLTHGGGELSLFLGQGLDAGSHLGDGGLLAVDFSHETLGLGRLLVTLLFICLQLLVAPGLVVGLGSSLFLQLFEQRLDHSNDLGKWVGSHFRGEVSQGLGVQLLGLVVQQLVGLRSRLMAHSSRSSSHLQEADLDRLCPSWRGLCLSQGDVLGVAGLHFRAGENLDGLVQSCQFVCPNLLILLIGGLLDFEGRFDLSLELLVGRLV